MNYWKNIKDKLDAIYNALQDEESRELFDARVKYMIDRDSDSYIDTIFEINRTYPKKWRCLEMENALENEREIIIYGCGHDGKISKRVLEISGYSVAYWCDSARDLWETYVEGVKVISPNELGNKHRDCLLVIGSKRYETEIRMRLFDVNFPTKNIFIFAFNQGVANCGKQYFDIFDPRDTEVFVDAGAYNGDSINDFLAWGGNKHYKIYAIEPLSDMCEEIRNKNIPNVEVINCAAWNRKEMLYFSSNMRGSGVRKNENEGYTVGGIIDEIVGEDKVSFIKMDIEGAELKALEGAKETILKWYPRLAICIYHKYEDIYEIGDYILSLNPNYKLYIRHYSTCMWETVLYAV